MTNNLSEAANWANTFGLAVSPLFQKSEIGNGTHNVLLDGGLGSFALSLTDERIWEQGSSQSWGWSSNLAHHVIVGSKEVAVTRWDTPKVELLTRSSVEKQSEAFYKFLIADRVTSSQNVTDHIVNLFRRFRSIVAESKISDDLSIHGFLSFLSLLISTQDDVSITYNENINVSYESGLEVIKKLPQQSIEHLRTDALTKSDFTTGLNLNPLLALRHAGSEIFQEAHFELLRSPTIDLFGYVGPAETKVQTRGGVHYTPPAIARTLVEQTFSGINNLLHRKSLVIVDPACGSGAFLYEALRTLRRNNFTGKLTLIGRDISQSAVSMAQFMLQLAVNDWQPNAGCIIDLKIADSLAENLPAADIILMNPPFIAWSALNNEQRDRMKDILKDNLQGRADYSMAFISHALKSLKPDGVLGSLFPASLLSLQAAQNWRSSLLEDGKIHFIASLGEYGLFSYAQVQIGAFVLKKTGSSADKALALVSGKSSEETGNALRSLRKYNGISSSDQNAIFSISSNLLKERATWRLVPPSTERKIERLLELGGVVTLGTLFDVKQGIRTGYNPAFLLSTESVSSLPKKERQWFLPAIMNESIQEANIIEKYYLFYPYRDKGLSITSEEELKTILPTYTEIYLQPSKEILTQRANITRAGRDDWWGLSERRTWALRKAPRIVSKYFGGKGGFAVDLDAKFLVVQGFAWFPKWIEVERPVNDEVLASETYELLNAYSALLNSSVFVDLLALFSPHVAGGQFDISPRYINNIPIPNLVEMFSDERFGKVITQLSQLGRKPDLGNVAWNRSVDKLVNELYGDIITR